MADFEDTAIRQAVVDDLRARARRHGLRRVVLFGSRVRGDHRPKSDIDLAVLGGGTVRFALEVDEEAPTLLSFDIVDIGKTTSDELRASVERDGRVLYEEI